MESLLANKANCGWAPMGSTGRLVRRAGADQLWSIASSRLPVAVDHWNAARRLRGWLDACRHLLNAPPAKLLLMPGVTGHRLLDRVADSLGVATIHGVICRSWRAWRRRDVSHGFAISPRLVAVQGEPRPPEHLAPRDQALWTLTQQLDLLHVRRGGAWSRHLDGATPTSESLPHLRLWDTLTEQRCDQAATNVRRLNGALHRHGARLPAPPTSAELPVVPLWTDSSPLWERRPVLTHFTRERRGPWPGQPDDVYGRLLLSGLLDDRSARGVVKRILLEQRLVASPEKNRAGTPVVCFSALAPTERVPHFQSHLRHWDATGFGIAVDRQWLARCGAQPVVYASEPVWDSLPQQLRPYFQAEGSAGRWRVEQEWRWEGDLNLGSIPKDLIEVFAPTAEDARALAPFSPWKIHAIAQGSSTSE